MLNYNKNTFLPSEVPLTVINDNYDTDAVQSKLQRVSLVIQTWQMLCPFVFAN